MEFTSSIAIKRGSPSTHRISTRRMAVGPNKERVGLESGAKAPRGLRIMPAAHYLIYKILKK